jgi:hypothetical protein
MRYNYAIDIGLQQKDDCADTRAKGPFVPETAAAAATTLHNIYLYLYLSI